MNGVIPEGDGVGGVGDDLAQLGTRTSLMTLNLLLSIVPEDGIGFADAAAAARSLSRRIDAAAGNFEEIMRKAG
ncbi:hypothetical protein [Niveispirillum sp. KHB5.9]|uniref:hypothetical protein n=1 Tax=Niveispirillum sp. KHB5.9 TaxID=3400269 RepID=UPI003A840BD2